MTDRQRHKAIITKRGGSSPRRRCWSVCRVCPMRSRDKMTSWNRFCRQEVLQVETESLTPSRNRVFDSKRKQSFWLQVETESLTPSRNRVFDCKQKQSLWLQAETESLTASRNRVFDCKQKQSLWLQAETESLTPSRNRVLDCSQLVGPNVLPRC